MSSKLLFFAGILAVLALFLAACSGGEKNFPDRGRYIYDEAEALATESEISLASYLWKLDSKTDYEIVLVFPKEMLDEETIINWFNEHGVGKKSIDNGAAIFVFPDSSVFTAIGSGNDKVSVTFSKTYGERIFKDFQDDPVLTLLRFTSALGGKIDESIGIEVGGNLWNSLKDNLNVILLWIAVIVLLLFFIQQFNGFQPSDLILPIVVLVIVGIFFGVSALGSSSSRNTYETYGMITSTKTDSYTFIRMHTVCTSTGKTTSCYSYPVAHTMYTNDVQVLNYEFKEYQYRFATEDSQSAWRHQVGEVDVLIVGIKKGDLRGVSGINDNSGGKTIGDGVWIRAGRK